MRGWCLVVVGVVASLGCKPATDEVADAYQAKAPAEAAEPEAAAEPSEATEQVRPQPPPIMPPASAPAPAEVARAPDADAPNATKDDAIAEPAEPEPAEPPDPFAEALAELKVDAGVLAAANALFIELHGRAKQPDEVLRRKHIDLLLAFLEAKIAALTTPEVERAMGCKKHPEHCEGAKLSPEAVAVADAFEANAVVSVYLGEGSDGFATDHRELAELLEPALSKPAKQYFEGLALGVKARAGYDDGMYFGDPDDIVEVIRWWEALGSSGGPAYADRHDEARELVWDYLYLTELGKLDGPKILARVRASHASFVAKHGDSRWHPVVEHFVAEAGDYTLSAEACSELIKASMKLVKPMPLSTPAP